MSEPNRSLLTEGILPAEADRVPTPQLQMTHVPHPDAPPKFQRCALLVGARGAGKTFLLRHRRHFVQPGALYINLRVELQTLARAYGIGSQATDLPADLETLVRRQAVALVALAIARELLDNGSAVRKFDAALLGPLIPKVVRPSARALDKDSAADLRRAVRALPDDAWLDDGLESADLMEFLLDIARSLDAQLTLFLDRADDVPSAAIAPLVGLLDQSAPYILVLAGRPAVAHAIPSQHDSGSVPGDHYDVIHLGVDPYSDVWQDFSSEAVRNYLAINAVDLPNARSVGWCHQLGRDSLRRSARLVQVAVATAHDIDLRAEQVVTLQSTLLAKIRGEMRTLHPDFAAYLGGIKEQVGVRLAKGPQIALELEIQDARSAFDLLGERDKFSQALLRAIRSEALSLPQGVLWHPYELPTRFEMAPLVAWDGRNTEWIQS